MRPAAAALAVVVALGLATAGPAVAQVRRQIRADSSRLPQRDSLRRAPGDTTGDTSRVGRGRGVPRTPSRQFPASDSIIDELLARRGFRSTRYSADSVQLLSTEKQIRLNGQSLVGRDGSILEADTIRYTEATCRLDAAGKPRLFDSSGVLVGEGMRYDACNHTGIVERAKTEMDYGGGTWYVSGNMAMDNLEDRAYIAHGAITTCDLVEPHYHFATREVKWVNKRLMVSRPAVLYVADVPILWLPFVFQDTRRGRRSGILAPQFGINDLVRFNPGYARHISNVGYYFAISDYADAQASLDWYAGRFLSMQGRLRYRLLNRFLAGGLALQEMHENGGTTSRRLSWSHQQQFSLSSSLTANLDYATSSRIISRNAVDPVLAIGTIDSRLNYQRRFSFGTLNVGGSRTQSLDKPQVTATFPTLAFTPNPIAISSAVTWSPSFSFTNSIQQNAGTGTGVPIGPGIFDSLLNDARQSNLSLSAPLRVGQWNLANGLTVTDEWSNLRSTVTDSVTGTVTTSTERFQTGVDWNAGIGLPVLFQGRWNLQPGVSMVNTAAGPFMIRNRYTQGQFISQGKRFQFSVGVAPTLFGLFPGFGPVARIRHAISPQLAWAYAPAAEVPLDYFLATNEGRMPTTLTQPPRQTVTFGLSQNFEAKLKPPESAAPDSARQGTEPPEGAKLKLLSIQSGGIAYDIEQAKIPGRTGWASQTWSNTVSSDLVRGFSLNFSHDLWNGPVGLSTSRFDPELTSMTFGFSLGANSINLVRRVLGLSSRTVAEHRDSVPERSATDPGRNFTNAFQRGPLATQYSAQDRLTPSRGGNTFQAQFNYSYQRSRAYATSADPNPVQSPANSMVGGTVQFSPTAHWTVSWQTSYNFTQGTFSDHVVRLDRDLHDWRASFTFVKSPNGNFLFNFYIALIQEPDLKFGYDQRNLR